jgi:hypothetical protein
MGFRIESYHRDELRKIAIPGKAVSTLFWVLPIGKWGIGELDRWWAHFTQSQGLCQQIGLLLVRDLFERGNAATADTADLTHGLENATGGSLLDLIPEAEQHWQGQRGSNPEMKSILVLSGAYPQPGWGVLIPAGNGIDKPGHFESLLASVIGLSCSPEKLGSIRQAAEAHHMRSDANHGRPRERRPDERLKDLEKASDALHHLFDLFESGSPAEMTSACDRIRGMLGKSINPNGPLPTDFWFHLKGRIKLLSELSAVLKSGSVELAALVDRFDQCPAGDQDRFQNDLDKRHASLLKIIRFLRTSWPELKVSDLQEFLRTEFRTDIKRYVTEALGGTKAEIERSLAELSIAAATEQARYQKELKSWQDRMRTAEETFRAVLPAASLAQWELGPSFLMALEKECSNRSIKAKSVPWDPARMIGWKLHVSNLNIAPQDLLVAANTVLASDVSQLVNQQPTVQLNGSLFADYAYFVSISAKRLSPWEATKRLLTELLSPSQFRNLIGENDQGNLFEANTKDKLAKNLLQNWGWNEVQTDLPRPLAGCLFQEKNGKTVLSRSLNETRTSMESFLKDLVRITIATLGWADSEIDEKFAVHCPNYRRTPRVSWKQEMRTLTVGAAIVLLEPLLDLSFTQPSSIGAGKSFCEECSRLLNELNKGSHDPPPPPPTSEELAAYGTSLQGILERASSLIGEMPWHLSPAQTFGHDPMIVTGHAWSHSHAEERLIRVMLWAGDKQARELLVWNKTLTNPVMTDALLL